VALSKEELDELAALEEEAKAEAAADKEADQRRHFEAMKLRKKYTTKDRKHGRDFGVVETKVGIFVIKKPLDTELDPLLETPDDRGAQEKFVCQILEFPAPETVKLMFASEPQLAGAIAAVALDLAKVTVADNAKK
jgi:hypothetical protein